jgi:hypothetical protein
MTKTTRIQDEEGYEMRFDLSNGIEQSISRCAELRSPFKEDDVVADLLPRIPRESREEVLVQALKMTYRVV